MIRIVKIESCSHATVGPINDSIFPTGNCYLVPHRLLDIFGQGNQVFTLESIDDLNKLDYILTLKSILEIDLFRKGIFCICNIHYDIFDGDENGI